MNLSASWIRRWLTPLALLLAFTLAGCASQDIRQYANEEPVLDLSTYFNGRLIAHGIFQNRSGQVVRRFVVEIDAQWEGNQGVLDE